MPDLLNAKCHGTRVIIRPMTDIRERYERAERFCEWNVRPRLHNVTVSPIWMADGDRFCYLHASHDDVERRLVDPVARTG